MIVIKDRVKETTSTTGTGFVSLSGAVQGYQSFAAIGNGNSTFYCIQGIADWEVGIGTYDSGMLTRDTVLASSNSNSLVSFGSGVKDVFCTYPANAARAGGVFNTASGEYSAVAGGQNNVASGLWSAISGGYGNTASMTWAYVGGGVSNIASGQNAVVAGGSTNLASGNYSAISGGVYGTTKGVSGFHAFPACVQPLGSTAGASQAGLLIVAGQTTTATPKVLVSTDSLSADATNQFVLANNSAAMLNIDLVGWDKTDYLTMNGINTLIVRGANAAATVLKSPGLLNYEKSAGASAWAVALSADTTNGCLKVQVTGAAGKTIRWVCRINSTEVAF